jgi:NADPH2:quinone reductase
MRAVQVTGFGGPEVLEVADVPEPVAGAGQVLIDVAVADVLFVDTQIRSGWGGEYFKVAPPYIAGNGVAGTVAEVGSGVDEALIGRRVIARVGRHQDHVQVPVGGYAQRAVSGAGDLFGVPDGLGLREATALLHDGTTALHVLRHAAILAGDWVLVNAAGGSLGALLVPLAKAAGAKVVGAARGERKLGLVREWGADLAVDYSTPGWAQEVRETTGGVRVVLDGTGGRAGREAFELTLPGARFLAYGAASGGFVGVGPDEAKARDVRLVGIGDLGSDAGTVERDLRRLLEDATNGEVRPFIGQTFPLERAADAHAAIEARETVGKTVLVVRPSAA